MLLKRVLALCAVSVCPCLLADSLVSCSDNGVTVQDPASCSLGPVAASVQSTSAITGNQFTASLAASVIFQYSADAYSATASATQTFALPPPASGADPNDVLEIHYLFYPDAQFSLGNAAANTAGFGFCAHDTGCSGDLSETYGAAGNALTLSADGFVDSLSGYVGSWNSGLASVTVSLFAPDGTTPLDFDPPVDAPEPGTFTLPILSAAVLLLFFAIRS